MSDLALDVPYDSDIYKSEKYYFKTLKSARDALQAQYHPGLFQQVCVDEEKEGDNLYVEVRHRHTTENAEAGDLVGYLEDY